jgi:membrane fusion protein, heavy metal efflux system
MSIRIYILPFAVLVVLLLARCGDNTKSANKEDPMDVKSSETVTLSAAAKKEIGLETISVALRSFSGTVTIPAKVISNQDNEAQVGSLVQGRAAKVFAKVGDFVKAGQELMLVEGLEIGEIKAGFLSAKANLDFQKANFDRQKTLIEQNIGSQKSFLEAQAEYQKAQAEFNAHDKMIHSIGLTDHDILVAIDNHADEHTAGTLPIRAPINGIIVERNVVIGQLVDGTTNAFKIINTSSVWIDGQIYEKDVNRIQDNSRAMFISSAYPDEVFWGKVIYIGRTIDEKSRTITVRADFNNQKEKLKPQMFGELRLREIENSMAILIPAESLMKIDNSDYVFIQKDDSTFEKRQVTVGRMQDELVEIKEGLKERDRLVVKGVFFLKSELMKEQLEGE